MEFAVGRASRKSPVKAYQQLEPKGSKWHLHGYVALFGNYVLMMFYTTVAGWMTVSYTHLDVYKRQVKTCAADGTMLETAWESRWMPGLLTGLIAQPVRAHA